MNISARIRAKTAEAELALADIYADIDRIARVNTEKVLDCFREAEVSESLFTPSTGYGYGDRGRDVIDELSAKIFGGAAGFMHPAVGITHHFHNILIVGCRMTGPEKGGRSTVFAQKFQQPGGPFLHAVVIIGKTADIGFHIKTENHIKSAIHNFYPHVNINIVYMV